MSIITRINQYLFSMYDFETNLMCRLHLEAPLSFNHLPLWYVWISDLVLELDDVIINLSSNEIWRPHFNAIGERRTGPSCFGSPAKINFPPGCSRIPLM